jgi:TonB family protein
MKRIILILSICVITINTLLCQSNDSLNNLNEKEEVFDENTSESVDVRQTNFEEEFDLTGKKGIRAKLLDDAVPRYKPEKDSESVGITIPKGEIVYVYKYYNEERCWATRFDETWGFVEDVIIFPVSETVTDTKATKYDEPPQLKTQIKPIYPAEAKKKGINGKVFIKVYIDNSGKATEVIILRGIDELNQAAIDAVKKAKYKPAKLEGEEVGVWVNLSINF